MDYNWDGKVLDSMWIETRARVEAALAPLGIGILEWACLEERLKGVKVEAVWSELQFQGMSLGGIYLPEATVTLVRESQYNMEKMGVVRLVDHDLALQMVSELKCFDETVSPVESLIGIPILTELGIQAWMIVKNALGYFSGYRFIRLLSRSTHGRSIVFHSVFPYNVELLCTDCSKEKRDDTLGTLVQVGPWYQNGRAWLRGWRLICPHMGAALADEVQASWRARGL